MKPIYINNNINIIINNMFTCPTCGECIVEMKETWDQIDEEIENTPMPKEYANCFCYVNCNDCHKETLTAFHIFGYKCMNCGSYNTARGRGGLLSQAGKYNTHKQNSIMQVIPFATLSFSCKFYVYIFIDA